MSIPQSTTASAAGSPLVKRSIPGVDKTDVEQMKDITEELLSSFPYLKFAPDVMYWLMATWGAESRWRLHFNHGTRSNPIMTSLHYTATRPGVESVQGKGTIRSTGTLIGNGYQYSSVIQNLWNAGNVSPEVRNNIKEGWYPHGVSACMGTYHVRGCPNNKGEWRHYPEAVSVIESLGLEVNPGESIFQTLFPNDDLTCRRKSIASGMVIFNYKYRRALETSNKGDTVGALQRAVGNFLGKFGTRDNNGISPEDRVRQLNATSGTIVSSLKAVGLSRTGDTSILNEQAIDAYDRDLPSSGVNTVRNETPKAATTVASSNGQSKKMPGCDIV